MLIDILGYVGVALVFVSFIVKRWVWLYGFNMGGAVVLTLYAYLRGDAVFTVLEAGIALYLAARFFSEVRARMARASRRAS